MIFFCFIFLFNFRFNLFYLCLIIKFYLFFSSLMGIGDWGLGIGDWGLGIGGWGQ
jgi:hypothetical protein